MTADSIAATERPTPIVYRVTRSNWAMPVFLLFMAAILKLPTLGQLLVESHPHRQTQTAFTALMFHEHGIDLLRPQIPVFGPPWVMPYEFPLFQAMGALLMNLGAAPDLAMRSLGMAMFLATGLLLFGLLNRMAGRTVALAALCAFLFSGFGLLWGRTSLIEYLATAGGLAFLWAGIAWAESGRRLPYAVALIAGTVAVLTKVTTGPFYLVVLLAYPCVLRRRKLIPEAVLIGLPLLLGAAWTRYTDAVKAANPLIDTQTSTAMFDWNVGGLAVRADSETWWIMLTILLVPLTGIMLFAWAPLAVAELRSRPKGRFLLAFLLVAGLLPLLVFTPLYREHDYYFAAISPAIATMVGLGFAWLWKRRSRRRPRLALLGLSSLWVASLVIGLPYWGVAYDRDVYHDDLRAAEYIAAHSDPDDVVVVTGRDWATGAMYYAGRRGVMEAYWLRDDPHFLPRMADLGYGPFIHCPPFEPCETFQPPDDS